MSGRLMTWLMVSLLACSAESKGCEESPATLPRPRVEWTDPSPHVLRRVTVAPGVQLEVLDWQGTGEPLVFLAGLTHSAHIYDEFAPAFTDRWRVLGITRRGFGASSQPSSGYDIETRVADLVAVLDSLGIRSANFVGHSIAGDELTGLAVRHPDRVRRLVYLDAAYDHTLLIDAPPQAPDPPMAAADKVSPAAVRSFYASYFLPMPEAEIRATAVFAPNGMLLHDVTPGTIARLVIRGAGQPSYTRVVAPALALYAMYETPALTVAAAQWKRLDDAGRKQVTAFWRWATTYAANERRRFRNEMKHGQVVELRRAHHYVWISHPREVREAIRRFLAQGQGIQKPLAETEERRGRPARRGTGLGIAH